MRLTYNAQKFMAAIAAIAMFCFGPAMARETGFVKNGDSYVTKDDNVIYRMTESPVQTTEACSSVDGLDVKNGDVTVVNGDLDGLYRYGDVAKFECNTSVKKTYDYKKSDVTLDLTSAKAGRAFPAALNSKNMAGQNEFYVLNEDMKVKKVYEDCPNNKVPGDEIGKDESKCYEKVTIYDVRVACSNFLQKGGDGVSPVYKNNLLTSKYKDVTASKDRCYNVSNGSFYSSSQYGEDPSTSESATCRDGFTKKTSGTFYKSETDFVTAKSDRPYCTNPTSGYFYGNPSDRPYTEYYDASVTLYEGCSYANVNDQTSDKKGVAGKGIVAKQNGETVCYMNKDKDDCYKIGTAFELYGFANVVNNATYGSQVCGTLVENIVVNENVLNTNGALNGGGSNFTPWTPMKVVSGVKVTLDGNGKTISGLYFNNENTTYVGLFGDVLGTVSIRNLGVKDSYFKGRNIVGGFVGYSKGTLTIANSYNSGTVSGSGDNVGGLVGYNFGANAKLTIENSYNAGPVSGINNVGGLVGDNNDGGSLSIENSYNSGTVNGHNNVGGLVGYNVDENAKLTIMTITNSYNSGAVSGSGHYVGGLVGLNYEGTLTITNSYNAGAVSGSGKDVGGLVGENYESATLTITNSYNAGTVNGINKVGGLVGNNNGKDAKLTITNSYNAGTVSGSGGDVGGLVGYNVGENAKLTITNSFFLETRKSGDGLGGEAKTLDDFHNGTVALLLHDWCEMDGDNCKVGGLNGSVWGQDFKKENSLPDLSGKFVGGTPHTLTLHTFEGDTRKLPTIYLGGKVLKLPTDLTREGFVFLGWSSKEVAESFSDIVTSIASDATGPKKFYAQWKKLNANGCFEISSTIDLYAFANVVNNATNGSKVCGTLTKDIVVNTGVLDEDGALNDNCSSFTPWNPMKVVSGVKVTLDGNGHTISGLYFNEESVEDVGLFGLVKDSLAISDLGVKDSYFKGRNNVGGLVGVNEHYSTLTITNSYNAGTVTGDFNVGGLVGVNSGTLTITNSYNSGTVRGNNDVGGLVGVNEHYSTLTITNSFFLGKGDNYGGTGKSEEEFHNGTVALLLHDWCEKEEGSETCKVGGKNGSVWGQDVLNGDVLPNFSGKINVETYELVLNTFEGDTRKYPTEYLSVTGLVLPMALERENHIFLGWSLKEVAESSDDIVTSIAKGETGAKTFYAQWKKLNANGCFEISSTFDLYAFANVVNNATNGSQVCGTLAENIVVNTCDDGKSVLKDDGSLNCSGEKFKPWTPMNVKSSVQVTFNGNGKTISGLYFDNGNKENVGLFGGVLGTVAISNLNIVDSYFKGRNNVGGLVGYSSGKNAKLSIENSYNSGTVSGSGDNVGGLVGYNDGGSLSIENSYNEGTVSGNKYVGGLVGYNKGGSLSIEHSYNAGAVSGNSYVGGLVGENNGENVRLTITNSYNAGAVTGECDVGGLVGENVGTLTITNSYNAGTVSGSGSSIGIGGLVGCGGGTLTITNSYNEGTVSGDKLVGGLVGFSSGPLTITNSYNAGTVAGDHNVGGLVGLGNGEFITNSYNAGAVRGAENVGGLVGSSDATLTITNSYNAGAVRGAENVGGLVGSSDATLTITNSFFLATDESGDDLGGEAKTLDDFHNGTVALLLHDWCEMDGDNCKVGGKNGSVWGQDFTKENSLPDLSGKIGHKYGSVVFFYSEDDQVDSAHVDATSELAVDFPNDVVVSGPVKFKRTFAGLGYSTIMLPFTPNCTDDDCVEGVKFFEFNSYTDGEVQATEVSPKDLKANTPYLVQAAGAKELVFKNGGTFNTTTGEAYNSETGEYKVALTGEGAGWTIFGTYEYKTWKKGDAGIGRTYGFAANDGVNDESIVGKFAKIAAGAYIYPMRAYLEYDAPVALARPAANGEVRTLASLPETINVVIIDKGETGTEIAGSDDASVEQTTRVIGTINTRTGEFKFANDRWFDLQGRYLGNKKPTQKGAYYNNGKKVIVK